MRQLNVVLDIVIVCFGFYAWWNNQFAEAAMYFAFVAAMNTAFSTKD